MTLSARADPIAIEEQRPMLAAEVFLRALKAGGVDFLIANPGTDFPPIVEAYARHANEPDRLPRAVLVAHETIAASMAHGAYLASGRPAGVMLHVNVGTANAICNLVNAQRDHIPLLLMAGRTPFMESGPHGSRSSIIHWGQEMFDQGGMLREIVKWDYEWKMPAQAEVLARRALAVAMAHPRGPVYLTLPREVLAATQECGDARPPAPAPPPVAGDPALAEVAELVRKAASPVLVTSAAGRDKAAVDALAEFASVARMPVVEHAARHLNLPQDHPWHAGFDPAPYLENADLVLVLESEVPWIPSRTRPRPEAMIVHLAADPLFQRYPVRSFPSDFDVAGDVAATLRRLTSLLQAGDFGAARQLPVRKAEPAGTGRIGFASASGALAPLIDTNTVVFNEYPLLRAHCPFTRPGSYFGHSPAGGLGWGFGAALGYKLAAPEKFVIAALGDGAYIFANPIAGHMVAAAENLPILVVVFNNARYGAVRRSTLGMYAQGSAAADDGLFLARLEAAPDYAEIAAAHGAHAETVTELQDLPAALARGKEAVLAGRQALVNIVIAE